MFDRFTDGARAAMAGSRKAAIQLEHDYIGTEHILLGLLERENEATIALTRLGVDLPALRRAVEEIAPPGPPPGHAASGGGMIPFTPRSKQALEEAMRLAGELEDHLIGCEHLLLGLLAEGEGVAARALGKLVSLERLREAALELPRSQAPIGKLLQNYQSIEDAVLEWAGDTLKRTLAAAVLVALDRGHNFLDVEHVLLGILEAGDSTATRALARLGIEASAVRVEVERRMAPGAPLLPGPPCFAVRLKRVLHFASREARDEGTGTEHILLGLLREEEGIAARALTALGVDVENLRAAVAAVRADTEGGAGR